MKFKDSSVKVQGIRPELLLALQIADNVYKMHEEELVITSLADGFHTITSLHFTGCAADLRTRYFDANEKHEVVKELKDRLTNDYDVVLERDHIHLEYQPKRR